MGFTLTDKRCQLWRMFGLEGVHQAIAMFKMEGSFIYPGLLMKGCGVSEELSREPFLPVNWELSVFIFPSKINPLPMYGLPAAASKPR